MDDAEACRRKMNNAEALINGLSGEKIRWTEASKSFDAQIKRLVGDVLLATGFLSYTGPFNQEFRNVILKSWKKEMVSAKIPFSDVSMAVCFSIFCCFDFSLVCSSHISASRHANCYDLAVVCFGRVTVAMVLRSVPKSYGLLQIF